MCIQTAVLVKFCLTLIFLPPLKKTPHLCAREITASKPGNILRNLCLKLLWPFGGKPHLWYSLLNLNYYSSDPGRSLFLGLPMDILNLRWYLGLSNWFSFTLIWIVPPWKHRKIYQLPSQRVPFCPTTAGGKQGRKVQPYWRQVEFCLEMVFRKWQRGITTVLVSSTNWRN